MRNAVISAVLFLNLSGVLLAESGMTIEVSPESVQPGDLFRMEVRMEREAFGRFELVVPGQDALHRVAVESSPVSLDEGVYRQGETWWLQADSSGEFFIEGAIARLETEGGVEEVVLPSVGIVVTAYEGLDGSGEALGLPAEIAEAGGHDPRVWWWLVPGVAVVGAVAWWMKPGGQERSVESGSERSLVDSVMEQLEGGEVERNDLQRLVEARGWSPEAREVLELAAYGGQVDSSSLAAVLRKEVGR